MFASQRVEINCGLEAQATLLKTDFIREKFQVFKPQWIKQEADHARKSPRGVWIDKKTSKFDSGKFPVLSSRNKHQKISWVQEKEFSQSRDIN